MSDGTSTEKWRRVSDQDKRQLSVLITLSWLVITLAVVVVVLLADFRRFENGFQKQANAIAHRLESHIRQNEAVLEGFAAFLSGQKELDEARVSEYARRLRQRFPHVFMLEVAQGVSVEDLPALISRQRQKGYAGFDVKAFDYESQRRWRPLPDRRRYYPLIFMSPMPEESRVMLGLDMGSHDFLDKPMQRALTTGLYQTSVPFTLIEGDEAYVMFKPVDGAEDISSQAGSQFIVLIVLLSDRLLAQIEPLLDDAMTILVYHSDEPRSDSAGHLFRRAASAGFSMLSTAYQKDLEEDRHGFILSLEKNLSLADVSWPLVVLAIILALLLFLYSRKFVLKRYSRDMERARDEARLQFLASYDTLTELPNRRYLVDLLESRLEESRADFRLALLFLDLDMFKQVNDGYGHRTGDALLHEVAQRIGGTLRKGDMAGRLGGDEFVVLLGDYASTESVGQVVEKLRAEIEAPYFMDGQVLNIKVSIGVAYYPEDTEDLLDLLHLADKAMYENKSRRKTLRLVN